MNDKAYQERPMDDRPGPPRYARASQQSYVYQLDLDKYYAFSESLTVSLESL